MNQGKTELLAPAGNFEKLKIALCYGADAVYLAGQEFGLRSAADNFSLEQLAQAAKLAQLQGVKLYLTLNALPQARDLELLPPFLKALAPLGLDGLILADAGMLKLVQQHLDWPLHISTQASVINSRHALAWKAMGAKRVILGREVSLEEAARLQDKTGLEVEVFIHGALCMSYSGRCSISNYTAGRDSNRGGCVHSCRFNYQMESPGRQQKAHFMSSKDLMGIDLVPRAVELGITSLKIEGRMKSNLYLASSLRAYRAVLDAVFKGAKPQEDWASDLAKLPHRDYTPGYLAGEAGADSIYAASEESPAEVELAATVLWVDQEQKRMLLQAKNKLKAGSEIELLGPGGKSHLLTLSPLLNLEGQEVAQLNAQNCLWLPWKEGITPHMVARQVNPRAKPVFQDTWG